MNVLMRNISYAVVYVALAVLFAFVTIAPHYILNRAESPFKDLVMLFQNPVAWWILVALILMMFLMLLAVEFFVPREKLPWGK